MKSAPFRIVALPEDVVRNLRERMEDDAGNVLIVRKDADRHQCRSCLRLTEPWEAYLAVSYRPMRGSRLPDVNYIGMLATITLPLVGVPTRVPIPG